MCGPRAARSSSARGPNSGIVVGEAITAGDALVGFVERLESHVARVRTFTNGDASVAVAGADARPSASGALVRHVGLLVAGNPPRLLKSPMPEAFRTGERLVTVRR
jgi:cell shape-determining protein MreC